MKLCFSTLSCPGWDWNTVLRQAKALGFDGIELRGILGELDATRLPQFQPDAVKATMAQLIDAGLALRCLDTSCVFLGDGAFDRAIEEGRAAITLAARLGTPYIRVFGDSVQPGMSETEAAAIVAEGIGQLAAYAEGTGVMVLQETHGDFTNSRMLLDVHNRVNSKNAGLIWDTANTFERGEAPETTWANLGHLIRHTHIKDCITRDGKVIPCLPGEGEVPIGRIIKTLRDGGYAGWLSFEWEKRWHSDIEEPEAALPCFTTHMRAILNQA